MKINLNKYTYIVNEEYGLSLPIPRGYEEAYKKDITQVKNYKGDSFDVLSKDYNYESVNISLNLTKNCNLACKYCFNHNKGNKRLDYATAVEFIDKIISLTPKAERYVIDLSGSGEPLIELNTILQIADYCYNKTNEIKKYIMPQLVCNGTLLTKEVAEKLQKANVLFGISIDGNKKIHDANRVFRDNTGSFEKIMKNVTDIENREYVGAAVTISNNNIKILDDVKFLSKYFNTIAIKIVRPSLGFKLDYETINKQYEQLTLYMLKEFKKGKIDTLMKIMNGDDFFGRFIFRALINSGMPSRCDAGIGKFSLDFDLNVYVCSGSVGIGKLKLGNLKEDIDLSKGRELQAGTINNSICNACKYQRLCGGECLVVSAYNNGICEEMCRIKKHLINLALFIKGELLFEYDDLLEDIYAFLEEKNNRSFADQELTKLSKKTDKYTFMELKSLKDNNDPLYFKIKKQYLK